MANYCWLFPEIKATLKGTRWDSTDICGIIQIKACSKRNLSGKVRKLCKFYLDDWLSSRAQPLGYLSKNNKTVRKLYSHCYPASPPYTCTWEEMLACDECSFLLSSSLALHQHPGYAVVSAAVQPSQLSEGAAASWGTEVAICKSSSVWGNRYLLSVESGVIHNIHQWWLQCYSYNI